MTNQQPPPWMRPQQQRPPQQQQQQRPPQQQYPPQQPMQRPPMQPPGMGPPRPGVQQGKLPSVKKKKMLRILVALLALSGVAVIISAVFFFMNYV